MNTTLILGGGTGGVVAANELRKKTGSAHKIVLIDREPEHVFSPSLIWLMVGQRKADRIARPLSNLNKKGITYVQAEIEQIDLHNKAITAGGQQYPYDQLIISLGAELAKPADLKSGGFNFYCRKGVLLFLEALRSFSGSKVVVLVSSIPFKCPAAPYEAAMLLAYYFRKKKMIDKVDIALYTPEAGPMGVAGQTLSSAVKQMVEAKGIKYFPIHQYKSMNGKTITFSDGSTTDADLLAYVPQHKCPRVLSQTSLVGESGWVDIKDRQTMETGIEGVYAIGDSTGIPLAMGKALPKAGVFAHYQAEVVAHNIAVDINGSGKKITFTGRGECFIETGDRKAGFARGNFYHEPSPKVKMFKPGTHWHAAKVLFEKDFLRKWF